MTSSVCAQKVATPDVIAYASNKAKNSTSHFGKLLRRENPGHAWSSQSKESSLFSQAGSSGSPCSSFTAHTIRSTQAAFAWQRSLRGLSSLWIRSASCRIFWSSPWLVLNCSSTKSWISFTKEVGRSVGKREVS